ncbi:hypothetical protein PMAYCL1PPCAC_15601 [Pristionchus mayeri]|uniref:G protein-coupled receptor n=1 Tax=Pristionchus mayeri TaxID=1317129 RepID=A0AAN5HYT4_9BILA|nr:hypothetical protein PMAYCL1PPCAC_15601 [Pristionchus mayeri]
MLRPIMQTVIGIEAALGIIFHIFVFLIISRMSDKTLLHYKFCLVVSTTHSVLYSVSNAVCVLTYIVDGDAVYSTLNGLVLFLPNWVADLSLVSWIFLAVFAWTTLPAAFMLQYLIIVKHAMPTWRILFFIYHLICFLISTPISTPIFATVALPLPSFAEMLEPTVRSMCVLSTQDRVLVYGGTLFP